jgi:hypothetical protein
MTSLVLQTFGPKRPRPIRGKSEFRMPRILMPLAWPSMPYFNECAIDPQYHSLDWFGDNARMIDFLPDLFFNAFADRERSVTCRGII